MFKINNKSTNDVKENVSWDVDLGIFSYIVIIAVYTFVSLYTNLVLTYHFTLEALFVLN